MRILGLASLIVAAVICPFGYWLHTAWYFVALSLTLAGGLLLTFYRSQSVLGVAPLPDHLEVPCVTKDIRDFPGSKITAEHAVPLGVDDDVSD